jgi:hypothetical protein
MPRGKAQEGSVSGWFRDYYTTHQELLKSNKNAGVFQAWSDAHGGREPGKSEKQALANVKSTLKKKFGVGKRGRKKKLMVVNAEYGPRKARICDRPLPRHGPEPGGSGTGTSAQVPSPGS